jgi:hypothetical protein
VIVFEAQFTAKRGVRAMALGSCRVTNPIIALRASGAVKICGWGLDAHHTAPEALQSLKIVAGELSIPDALSPYIFETDCTPPVDQVRDLMRTGIDVFVLEVSTDQQFCFGDYLLQQNFVARRLVQAHRGALLDWYRQVCRGQAPDEETVQTALENLRARDFEPTGEFIELLRGVRLRTQPIDEIAGALEEMMARFGGRWLVIGPFVTPGQDGAVMQDRRALNTRLAQAAQACGAVFHDPTELIVTHGAQTALDGGGADIYEYAPSFYPTVGEHLVMLVRQVEPKGRRLAPPSPPKPPPTARVARPSLYAKLKKGLARRTRKLRGR